MLDNDPRVCASGQCNKRRSEITPLRRVGPPGPWCSSGPGTPNECNNLNSVPNAASVPIPAPPVGGTCNPNQLAQYCYRHNGDWKFAYQLAIGYQFLSAACATAITTAQPTWWPSNPHPVDFFFYWNFAPGGNGQEGANDPHNVYGACAIDFQFCPSVLPTGEIGLTSMVGPACGRNPVSINVE